MEEREKKFPKFVRKNWLFLTILILFFSWAFYSYFSDGILYYIIHQDVGDSVVFIHDFGKFAMVIFILLVILEVILAPIPPLVLYIAGGILFGAFLGGTLTLVGNLIGAFIDFKIARNYGRKFVERKVDEKLRKKFDSFSEKYGAYSIFFLRINPFTSSDLFSYLAGLSKMKAVKFMLGTALGLIPLIYVQTYFGEFFVKKSAFLSSLVIVLSIIYILILIYFVVKLFFTKNENHL